VLFYIDNIARLHSILVDYSTPPAQLASRKVEAEVDLFAAHVPAALFFNVIFSTSRKTPIHDSVKYGEINVNRTLLIQRSSHVPKLSSKAEQLMAV
jgi:hypothetical protein